MISRRIYCQNVSTVWSAVLFSCDLRVATGVKTCQQLNMSGEDLFFKWEAMRFNRGPSQFSVTDVNDIKKSVLREAQARMGVSKRMAKGALAGPQSRNFASTPVKSGVRSNPNGPMGTPIKPMVRPQDGFDLSRMEEKVVPAAGPSRVTFVGPSEDEEERKRRTCEYRVVIDDTRTCSWPSRPLHVREGHRAK